MSPPEPLPQQRLSKYVVSCSGSCPIGELCDRIARKLHRNKKAQMLGLSQIISQVDAASQLATAEDILLLEGCHVGCLRDALGSLGYGERDYLTLDLSKHGMAGMARSNDPAEDDLKHGYREALALLKAGNESEGIRRRYKQKPIK